MAFRAKETIRLWRVGHAQYPLWSGEGSRIYGGRWTPKGVTAIYTCESYSLSILEVLVNLRSKAFPSHFVRSRLDIPSGMSAERVHPNAVPNWDRASDLRAPQEFGARWIREARSLLLYVPSVVVEGLEWNVVINPNHPEFARLHPESPIPV